MASMRASKSGIAADIERKMERKMQELEEEGIPGYIVDWLNAVLGGEAIAGRTAKDIHVALKDGVLLVTAMNTLRDAIGLGALKIERTTSRIPSMAAAKHMDNIGRFLKAAEEYGIKAEDLFQTADLYEGSRAQMVNVVNGLHAVGLKANAHGFSPQYGGPGGYATQNVRGFTEEEVKAKSSAIIGKQTGGSHGLASQAGMRAPGTGRFITDVETGK